MAKVKVPTALRALVGGNSEIETDAKTVGEAIADVAERYPDAKGHLYGEGGELRSFVNVFVGDDSIRSLQGLQTPIAPGDLVLLVPSIAGGQSER